MTGTGELKWPERSFSYSRPGVKTLNVMEVPASPGVARPLVAQGDSWSLQGAVEKLRTILEIQEISRVDCVFYLPNATAGIK